MTAIASVKEEKPESAQAVVITAALLVGVFPNLFIDHFFKNSKSNIFIFQIGASESSSPGKF